MIRSLSVALKSDLSEHCL